ncbi:MAG: glycosyltransferase family 2 protein [Rhizobiaceae bacterium]|nr:glycosyltransferase family 2 protein [Rhizobiaceae bacterium]
MGIAISLLSNLSVIDRLRRLQPPRSARPAVVSVILPITGPSRQLPEIIAALERQTLKPRRLIVAVESTTDPAFAAASHIAGSAALPIEIVVAGPATHQAQKCRNQQAAIARIDDGDEVVVLMDGDIRPRPNWLSALASPIADDHSDVVTGHRWQQVAAPRLGAHLIAAVDRAVTLLPRSMSGMASVVWGGSVGISRRAALRSGLFDSLDRTLSDDLSLSEHAASAGLRVLTRGALLVPSPNDQTISSAWHFGRRQYQIGHLYRPWLWRLALVAVNLRLVAWFVAVQHVATGGGMIWALVLLLALAVLKQVLVGEVARRLDMPDPPEVRFFQLALGVLQPLVDLFHSSVVIASATTRRIIWGHVVYDIAGPYEINVKERRPFSAA